MLHTAVRAPCLQYVDESEAIYNINTTPLIQAPLINAIKSVFKGAVKKQGSGRAC